MNVDMDVDGDVTAACDWVLTYLVGSKLSVQVDDRAVLLEVVDARDDYLLKY